VLDVRVADIDLDGHEDVVAVTAKHLLLFRGGRDGIAKTPDVTRPAAALTVVGNGLLGVVRNGRYHAVDQPFRAWMEGEPGASSLLGALGTGPPALLDSPGDLNGDGRDDPILSELGGVRALDALLPVRPESRLEIRDNETFAVRYELPVPVIGNWKGTGRQLIFAIENAVIAFEKGREVSRLPLPPPPEGENAADFRRRHILLQDVDADGRLDMLVVQAKGSMKMFSVFECVAALFRGGHIYDPSKKRYFRPVVRKVPGILLRPALRDVDGDKDLDLILGTVAAGGLTGNGDAPGVTYVFRFERDSKGGTFSKRPAWTLSHMVPMTSFTDVPRAPTDFLPDWDGDHKPCVLERTKKTVRLFTVNEQGYFLPGRVHAFPNAGRPSIGKTLAAVPGPKGVLIVREPR